MPAQFQDFGSGVIPLSGVLYFLGIAAAMLYLNMVLLGRRHWAGGESERRALAPLDGPVRLGAAGAVQPDRAGRPVGQRADASDEGLHTLSRESLELIKQIPTDRPVFIQATTPRGPPRVRRDQGHLLGLLREYAARSGDRIR